MKNSLLYLFSLCFIVGTSMAMELPPQSEGTQQMPTAQIVTRLNGIIKQLPHGPLKTALMNARIIASRSSNQKVVEKLEETKRILGDFGPHEIQNLINDIKKGSAQAPVAKQTPVPKQIPEVPVVRSPGARAIPAVQPEPKPATPQSSPKVPATGYSKSAEGKENQQIELFNQSKNQVIVELFDSSSDRINEETIGVNKTVKVSVPTNKFPILFRIFEGEGFEANFTFGATSTYMHSGPEGSYVKEVIRVQPQQHTVMTKTGKLIITVK